LLEAFSVEFLLLMRKRHKSSLGEAGIERQGARRIPR
jgi:hypothetical protein